MQLRAVVLYAPGYYQLQGYRDTGPNAGLFFGIVGTISACAAQAAMLIAAAGGPGNSGITYDPTNHDPFDIS